MVIGLSYTEVGLMNVFSFKTQEVTSLYHRVLKSRDLSLRTESETTELKDIVNVSVAAKRQNILEETQSAVLDCIKAR